MPSLKRDEVRDIDRQAIEIYGLSGVVLMENAGRGASELLVNLGIGGRVVVCAGKGNNGGDGFVMARHLDLRGVDVRVLLLARAADISGDAAINLRVLKAAGMDIVELDQMPAPERIIPEFDRADWIIDALLGTGTRGAIREPYVSVIASMNASGKKILAVDLPSGMDCDTGLPLGACVRAHHTATFVAAKRGFEMAGATEFTGCVHTVDIGAPRCLIEQAMRESNLRRSPAGQVKLNADALESKRQNGL